LLMLTTGTLNTLVSKYQNRKSFECNADTYECELCPETSSNITLITLQLDQPLLAANDTCIDFEQPVYQTFLMFLGETLCFILYYSMILVRRVVVSPSSQNPEEPVEESQLTGVRKLLFIIPTLCDMVATTLMNLGLIYTHASVYQMLRGAIVIFTGILSIIILKRKQYAYHWLGMFLVVCGIGIVGVSPLIDDNPNTEPAKNPVLGDILIIVAQVFSACQFIFEEKYMSKYKVPALQGVGYEGIYGVVILAVLMPIFNVAIGQKQDIGGLFDIRFAFETFIQFPSILISSLAYTISIASFNFFGLSITKVLSATSRSTIDALRTLSVWIFGLILGWETFIWLQVIGFVVLIAGTSIYNEIIRVPKLYYPSKEEARGEGKPLLDKAEEDN